MEKLPTELVLQVGYYIDLYGLRSWMLTARRYREILEYSNHIYMAALHLDEELYGYPVSLLEVASLNRIMALNAIKAFNGLVQFQKDAGYNPLFVFDQHAMYSLPIILLPKKDRITTLLALLCRWGQEEMVRILLFDKCVDLSTYFGELDIGSIPLLNALDCQDKAVGLRIIKMLFEAGEKRYSEWMHWMNRMDILGEAAANSDPAFVRYLLGVGNFSDAAIENAWWNAARNENPAIAKTFIDAGVQIGEWALSVAVENDNVPVLRLLIDAGVDIHQLDGQRYNIWANASSRCAGMLLESCPDLVTFKTRDGRSCVDNLLRSYTAAPAKERQRVLCLSALFIMKGYSINPSSADVHWALVSAAQRCDSSIATLLLGNERSLVDFREKDQNTPLHIAAFNCYSSDKIFENRMNFIGTLIGLGCDVKAINAKGMTILHCLFYENITPRPSRFRLGNYDDYPKLVWYLIHAGVDISITSSWGRTALLDALKRQLPESAVVLLDAGIVGFVSSTEMGEAIHIALLHGYAKVLRRLCEAGVDAFDIHHRDESGRTILHSLVARSLEKEGQIEGFARMVGCILLGYHDVSVSQVAGEIRLRDKHADKNGWLASIRYLCQRGVDTSILDNRGETAFDLVKRSGLPLPWDSVATQLTEWLREDRTSHLVLNWDVGQEKSEESEF